MTTLGPYRSETVCSSQHPIPKPICKVPWGSHSLSSHWGPSCATWGHAHEVAGRGTEHLRSLGLAFHGDGTYGPVLQKRTPPYPINPFLWPAQCTDLTFGKYGHQKPNGNSPIHFCGCHPRIQTPTKKLRASDDLHQVQQHS